MESELDWKSSCIHVAFNLNCEILSLGFRVFETARVPLCASFSVERKNMDIISGNSDLEFRV